uniref:DUF4371 domain-containing protein n=1 Tax=Pelodiscus sinensis TaxID=13735 RepID=K7FQJ5_PELSI
KNVKRKHSEDYIKFSFTWQEKEGMDLPQCVICFKVLGNDSMKLAKLKLHLEKCHPNLLQKDEDYFERQLSGLKWQHLDSTSAFYNKTSNAVCTSYIVAYKVAQAKKPHTIVEQLVLSCSKEMVRLVLGEEAARKPNDISVSNDTVSRRINEISQNISKQVVDEIKKSPLFAIQLDESTDVALCSQLLVFARYMVRCKTLDTTTKAQDVMEIVNNFFEVHGVDWVNLVGVTTDGAPPMLGSRSGFQTLVKQRAPMVTGVHCFIHREALASKTLPDQLNTIFKGLVKVVNHIHTRLFKRFCLDMGSDFDVLLFYTSVWWCQQGTVFNRVFLREEFDLFLQAQGKTQSNLELADLGDIFGILNKLTLQLQGKGANLFSHQSIIKAFLDKLELWIVRVEGNNLVQFPYVDAMLGENCSQSHPTISATMQILDHLQKLRDKFQRYFLEVDRTRDGLSFIRNPFTTDVNSVPEDLQESFLDLKNDLVAQDVYQQSTIEKFWASMTGSCPNLSAHAVRFLLPFASTYMCETGFSCLLHV